MTTNTGLFIKLCPLGSAESYIYLTCVGIMTENHVGTRFKPNSVYNVMILTSVKHIQIELGGQSFFEKPCEHFKYFYHNYVRQ